MMIPWGVSWNTFLQCDFSPPWWNCIPFPACFFCIYDISYQIIYRSIPTSLFLWKFGSCCGLNFIFPTFRQISETPKYSQLIQQWHNQWRRRCLQSLMHNLWDLYCSLKVFVSSLSVKGAFHSCSSMINVWGDRVLHMPAIRPCTPETHPPLCCKEQRRQTSFWAIRKPGVARRSYHLVVCLPQWKIGQNHVLSCFASPAPSLQPVSNRAQGAARVTYSPFLLGSKCLSVWIKLVANLPGLDQSIWFPSWWERGI